MEVRFTILFLKIYTFTHYRSLSYKVGVLRDQVRSTCNQRACMTRCMNIDEAKVVCKDRSRPPRMTKIVEGGIQRRQHGFLRFLEVK